MSVEELYAELLRRGYNLPALDDPKLWAKVDYFIRHLQDARVQMTDKDREEVKLLKALADLLEA